MRDRVDRPLNDILRQRLLSVDRLVLGLALLLPGCNPTQPSDRDPAAVAPASIGKNGDGNAVAPATPALQATDWFEDCTAVSGIEFTYQNGRAAEQYTILETVGGGVGLVDFDCDGQLDLFCPGGGSLDTNLAITGLPCGLFRNTGNGTFQKITKQALLDLSTDYSHGCVAGDLNQDGFPDLLMTCFGSNSLFINQGDGTYDDATAAAGLHLKTWSTAAALGDVDRDGNLDLFVCGYVDWQPPAETSIASSSSGERDVAAPQQYAAIPDHLYRNQGDGTFIDISVEAGIRRDGMGLGVVAADLNQDGYIDFYVANDVVANHLYWGGAQWPLREAGEFAGAAYNESGTPEGSMGVDTADINGDGQLDIWVTNFELEDNSLYLNSGQQIFQHATAAVGLSGSSRPYVGFGTGLCDFNSDGWPDIYVLNGHVRYHSQMQPFEQPSFLYQNLQGRRFQDVTTTAGPWFQTSHAARGGAVGDLNQDGALDLVVSAINQPVTLLMNHQPAENWIRLNLVGTTSPRTAVGALVRLRAFDRDCIRPVVSGGGFLSQSDLRLLIALEPARNTVDVQVDWPSGYHETFTNLQVRHDQALVEGQGTRQEPTGSDRIRE